MLTKETLAKYFDHTYLKAMATTEIMTKLCNEAKELHTASVAVNTTWVPFCKEQLKDSDVKVCAVIAFPLGQCGLETKLNECKEAIAQGADEVDYVLDCGRVIMGDYAYIEEEMTKLTQTCHNSNKAIKVILETCYLTKEQIKECAIIASRVKPDFIKTSTGFGTGGATVEDVEIMVKYSGADVKVKASGGIRDLAACEKMIEAGADRIGTSSSIAIMNEFLTK